MKMTRKEKDVSSRLDYERLCFHLSRRPAYRAAFYLPQSPEPETSLAFLKVYAKLRIYPYTQ